MIHVSVRSLVAAVVGLALLAPAAVADEPLSSQEALAELDRSLDGTVRDPVTPAIAPQDWLGEHAARLGRGRVLLSSRPLRAEDERGRLAPVDLTLQDNGATLAPRNAPFELRLTEDLRGGFWIGPSADQAIHVIPLSVAPDGDRTVKVEDQLFAANTHEATDTLIRPSVSGVETFDQLRDASAPEVIEYRVVLRPGQALRARDGGAEVVLGNKTIVRVLPPIALDADRRPVATVLEVEGDLLRLEVAHRDRPVRYPVVVDPAWNSSYDWEQDAGTGNQGIAESDDAAPGGPWYELYADVNGPPGFAPGITAYPFGGKVYPANTRGMVVWSAPGTSRISRVTWRDVSFYNDRDRQTLRLALYPDAGTVRDWSAAEVVMASPAITIDDPTDSATSAQLGMMTPPCADGEDDCPRFIARGTRTFAAVGAVDLELVDNDAPTVDAVGPLRDLAERWTTGAGEMSVTPTFRDGGSGVATWSFSATDAGGDHPISTAGAPCDEHHTQPGQGSWLCFPIYSPGQLPFDLGQLPEGATTFKLSATAV